MFRLMLAAVASAMCLAFSASAQTAPGCGERYIVRPGDTLMKIARRVYGEDLADFIHEQNFAAIGRDPALIEVGVELWLPCRDAGGAVAAAVDAAKLRVLAGGPRRALIGADQPDGGLMPEMLAAAAGKAGLAVASPVIVPVADDRLAALLTAGAADVGFPWTRPACAVWTAGPAAMADCQGLLFSDPFYEVEIGLYAAKGSPYASASGMADLRGARVCRPVTLAAGDLAGAAGAMVLRAGSARECLELLQAGAADVASFDALDGEALVLAGRWSEVATPLPFATKQTLHAVVAQTNPRADEILAALNAGLAELRRSGAWFAMSHRRMALQRSVAGRPQPRG